MKILVAIWMSLFFSNWAVAVSMEEDVSHYSAMFAGNEDIQPAVLESFAWMGISDVRVFDLIEQRVLTGAEQGRNDKARKNEIALCIRALGFSGQSKYVETLNRFVTDRSYSRYAKNALHDLPNYKRWNPVISNREKFNPHYSDDVNRIMNMLLSDDFLLKRIGAKRVYFSNKDGVLLDALANQIREVYTLEGNDAETSDAIAWMVKALGSARQEKYDALLQEVSAKAGDRKVAKYAERALDR